MFTASTVWTERTKRQWSKKLSAVIFFQIKMAATTTWIWRASARRRRKRSEGPISIRPKRKPRRTPEVKPEALLELGIPLNHVELLF